MGSDADHVREQLKVFFRGKPILKAEYFGLCARNGPEVGSVELLVTPVPGVAKHQIFEMEGELESILGRRVSILARPSVEAMKHGPARELILGSAAPVYERSEAEAATATSYGPPPPPRRPVPLPIPH